MRGSDNRMANVIVTVVVSWFVGVPLTFCLGAVIFDVIAGQKVGPPLTVAATVLIAVVPGVFAAWWNYYRRKAPPNHLRPWV